MVQDIKNNESTFPKAVLKHSSTVEFYDNDFKIKAFLEDLRNSRLSILRIKMKLMLTFKSFLRVIILFQFQQKVRKVAVMFLMLILVTFLETLPVFDVHKSPGEAIILNIDPESRALITCGEDLSKGI